MQFMQARNWETICTPGDGVKKGIFRCLKGVASKKFFRTSDSFQRPLKKGELSNIRFDFIQNFIWHKTFPVEGANIAYQEVYTPAP